MTDYAKMTLADLLDRLFYETPMSRRGDVDAIKAEIARRIETRDRVVRQFMEDGAWHKVAFNHGTTVHADDDYNPTYFDKNGEQIL